MTTTTDYGEFSDNCRDSGAEATLHSYVATALGDHVDDYDVDSLAVEFRAAINEALARTGIALVGDKFYGPYPVLAGWETTIADAIESVNFWTLAAKYDITDRSKES